MGGSGNRLSLRSGLNLLRTVLAGLLQNDSPRQVAAGIALGMLLGFVPKGNLIALVLSVLLLGTQANLAAGALATALFAAVGWWSDPFAHRVGLWLLEQPGLGPYWARLYNLPLAPWSHFNNTLVMGNLLIGLGLLAPVYWIAKLAVPWFRTLVIGTLQRLKFHRPLSGSGV